MNQEDRRVQPGEPTLLKGAEEDARHESPTKPDSSGQQIRRIEDYRRRSLEQPDPQRSALGVISANLMELECALMGGLRESLSQERPHLERFRKLGQALDQHLRICRQIDRFARFEHLLEKAEEEHGGGTRR